MSRQEFGDWQTPGELAAAALSVVRRVMRVPPATVVEPTCGEGAFLIAAASQFRAASLAGYELNPEYVATARERVPKARVKVADFFDMSWERELAELAEPLLVTGNPPWVTNSSLGVLGSNNLPAKANFKGLSGFEAMTGRSNFDVSEWMILRLLEALRGRRATVAMLCKTAVARKVIEHAISRRWGVQPIGLWRIDAMGHFRAAVDAVLFVCELGARSFGTDWPVYASVDTVEPESTRVRPRGLPVPNSSWRRWGPRFNPLIEGEATRPCLDA